MDEFIMVSVIVPVYNVKNYIKRCLESLIKQDYDSMEIVIIDDGSTDGSKELCDSCKMMDTRIRVFHKENGGVSSARNLGMEKSRGRWILFVDPDDYVKHDFVSKMVGLAVANPHMCVACHFENIDVHGRYIITKNNVGVEQIFYDEDALLSILGIVGGFAWNKIFNREIIKKNGLLFLENIFFMEDLLFTFSYVRYCSGVILSPESLYCYVENSDGITSETYKRFEKKKTCSMLDVTRIILDNIPEDYGKALETAKERRYWSLIHYYVLMYKSGCWERPLISHVEEIKEFKSQIRLSGKSTYRFYCKCIIHFPKVLYILFQIWNFIKRGGRVWKMIY